MTKTMSASNAKNNFGYLLEEVYIKGGSVIITKNNKPIAKVSPIYNYENTDTTPPLTLSDKEYDEIKNSTKEYRETFNFSY